MLWWYGDRNYRRFYRCLQVRRLSFGHSKGYGVAKVEADKAVQEIRDILARKEAEEKEAKARELELLKKQEEHGKKYLGNW